MSSIELFKELKEKLYSLSVDYEIDLEKEITQIGYNLDCLKNIENPYPNSYNYVGYELRIAGVHLKRIKEFLEENKIKIENYTEIIDLIQNLERRIWVEYETMLKNSLQKIEELKRKIEEEISFVKENLKKYEIRI